VTEVRIPQGGKQENHGVRNVGGEF